MKAYVLPPLLLQKLIWIPTNLVLRTFGRLQVYGLENLRGISTNVIFAVNHASEFDVFLVPAALPFFSRFSPMFYTSREQSFYIHSGWKQHFYGGNLFKAWGSYPVTVGLHDYAASLTNQTRILRDGGNLCIFPEGSKTKDGQMKPAKGGVAHLSYATKLPIVPVRLGGTYRVKFSDFIRGRRTLSIAFGAPVWEAAHAPRIPSYDMFKGYAQNVMNEISKLPVAIEAAPAAFPIAVPEVASPSLARQSPVQPTIS